jgi:omega-6 fatty acid desaturase (delta-12 desaturase)
LADPSSEGSNPGMRTGKELILATKPYAVDFPARSWAYLLSTATLSATAIAGTLWKHHPAIQVMSSFLAGLFFLRFFVIYHDQQHEAILRGSRVAEGLMRVFGILILSPSSVWRSSHNHHHNHNSQLRGSHIGSFPIMTKAQYSKASRGTRFEYLFMRHPLTILFGYIFIFLYGMCLYPAVTKLREHYECLIAVVVHALLGLAITWFLGWQALLLTLVIPHFVASAIGSYLFYAQHNFPGVTFNDKAGWSYEKAALDSSSFLKTGPVVAWFTANIGYHHIHHLNSRIPFYRLPEAYRAMPELRQARSTSLHPRDIFRCLRLKVWCVESQRMVGVQGL